MNVESQYNPQQNSTRSKTLKQILISIFFLVLLTTGAVVIYYFYWIDQNQQIIPSKEQIEKAFNKFIYQHERDYSNSMDYKERLEIFSKNYLVISEHNQKKSTFKLKINKFADWRDDELRNLMALNLNKLQISNQKVKSDNLKHQSLGSTPASVDWEADGFVSSVKDQGKCGDCYSFSAIAVLESSYKMKYKELQDFSEQQVVDCSWNYGNQGCGGGLPHYVFEYFKDNKIEEENSYPYKSGKSGKPKEEKGGQCSYKDKQGIAKVKDYQFLLESNEIDLKSWTAEQPISVAMAALCPYFVFYDNGIIENDCWDIFDLDHAIVVVGYGTIEDTKFWKIKNSWGSDWGENGYARIKRHESKEGYGLFDLAYYIAKAQIS